VTPKLVIGFENSSRPFQHPRGTFRTRSHPSLTSVLGIWSSANQPPSRLSDRATLRRSQLSRAIVRLTVISMMPMATFRMRGCGRLSVAAAHGDSRVSVRRVAEAVHKEQRMRPAGSPKSWPLPWKRQCVADRAAATTEQSEDRAPLVTGLDSPKIRTQRVRPDMIAPSLRARGRRVRPSGGLPCESGRGTGS
jgi:hypothetical protein